MRETNDVSSPDACDDLLPLLIELVKRSVQADDVSLFLNDRNGTLAPAAFSGVDREEDRALRFALGSAVAGALPVPLREPIVVEPGSDARFASLAGAGRVRSAILYPLLSRAVNQGVLCAARTANDTPFGAADRQSIESLAPLIAQAARNTRLYRDREARSRALEDAYGRLLEMQKELVRSEKLAATGQLSAGLAHELNNPLTIVIGLAEMLLLEDPGPEGRRRDILSIKAQAERCRKTIQDMLQFARTDEDEKKICQINDILDKTLGLFAYSLHEAKIELVKEFDRFLPQTSVAPCQIRQVFINILNNAVQALHGCARPRLVVTTALRGSAIAISFTDNGCGIPESMLTRIFDPFFTTREVGKGVGMGLSVSYGIVMRHRGEIRVKSSEGAGSTFTIELPVISVPA